MWAIGRDGKARQCLDKKTAKKVRSHLPAGRYDLRPPSEKKNGFHQQRGRRKGVEPASPIVRWGGKREERAKALFGTETRVATCNFLLGKVKRREEMDKEKSDCVVDNAEEEVDGAYFGQKEGSGKAIGRLTRERRRKRGSDAILEGEGKRRQFCKREKKHQRRKEEEKRYMGDGAAREDREALPLNWEEKETSHVAAYPMKERG